MQLFELVTAAHHFISEALPLRDSSSSAALSRFIASVRSLQVPSSLLRSVAIEVLTVLGVQANCLPGVLEWYLERCRVLDDPVDAFDDCVRRIVRQATIDHPLVRKAMDYVNDHYADAQLSLQAASDHAGCQPPYLCSLFRGHVGVTFAQYVREKRLTAASVLLTSSNLSVKQVWVEVGYKHASDFDHHFKQRFGVTPKHYRIATCSFAVNRDAPATSLAQCEQAWAGYCVPIVDDDPVTRDTLERYLRPTGVAISSFSRAIDLLRGARQLDPDAVLLDFRMPDMDGLQCLRALRRLPGCANIPVILFSADWELELHVQEWQPLGASLMSKLCDMDDVMAHLDQAFRTNA